MQAGARRRPALALALALAASLLAAAPTTARSAGIALEEAMVPADEPGIRLYLRNKHPEGVDRFGPDRTLLFVHGATYPAETSFDLPLGGRSWMDAIAERGFDVYLVDLRGYGRSTRPEEMDQPPEANGPIVTTDVAIRDVGAAVDHILRKRGIDRLDLLGWSWGTAIMAGYAQANPQKVDRLVLYATLWELQGASPLGTAQGKMGAYRTVTRQAAYDRWVRGVPQDKRAGLIPEGWFDAWADATFATDPRGAAQDPPVLRAPNGVRHDVEERWQKGEPTWDPARITAPVLLVQAEWDQDTPPYMSQAVFPLLTHAPWKRYTLIGEGTHTIIMERNRQQLFDVVQTFLEEPAPR